MKKIFIISMLIIASFMLSGCDEDKNMTNITVAEVTHSVFYAPWYVAINEGYFEEEGLNIEVILTSGADKVGSAVLSGDAQIGLSGLEATLYVYDNGAKDYLISFAALTKRDGQFLFGDCSLKDTFTIEDLKGKSVLVGRTGGMPAMVFNYGLYKNGLTDKDVILDTSVEFASLSGAYIGKQADFVNLFEPTALSLEKEGYGCVLASVGLMSGEVPYTVFHTKKSYLENNEETIKKFTKAIDKGIKYVMEHDDETVAKSILNSFADTSLEDLTEIVKRYREADSWWENTYISEKAYNNLIDLMKYNDALEVEVDYNTIVSNKYNGHTSSN